MKTELDLKNCKMCPRMCSADRTERRGYCGAGEKIEVSKIMLHKWEEPPISGSDERRGSGAIFFTHCPLGCAFCQNRAISSSDAVGKEYTAEELAYEMLCLQNDGAYNINLVSPTQYSLGLKEAVSAARRMGLTLPIVWNTGGFERAEIIEELVGTVDIFLTDLKYISKEYSELYSSAPNYAEFALHALKKMYESVGEPIYGEDGMLKRGVIVRHLVLPSCYKDSIEVLQKLSETVPPDKVLISLMAQYTPDFLPKSDGTADKFGKIRRLVTSYEYSKVANEACRLGFDGFTQDRRSATKKYTPDFS